MFRRYDRRKAKTMLRELEKQLCRDDLSDDALSKDNWVTRDLKEHNIDENRLQFLLWLIEHGHINGIGTRCEQSVN